MGLEQLLSREISRTAVSISKNKKSALDHLMRYELPNYFNGKKLSEDEIDQHRDILSSKLDETFEKYKTELTGTVRKVATRGTMLTNIANQIYTYLNIATTPIAYMSGVAGAMFLGKTVAEIPALYRYLKKSKDWYGATTHLLAKGPRYFTPVLGSAIEAGAFERMVMKGVLKETKKEFLKEIDKYVPEAEYIKEKMGRPLSEAISIPKKLAPAFA